MTSRRQPADAFTLLEVILAMAILALSLAALGHAVRLSHQNAERTAIESDATIIAESVLAELLSGVRTLTEVQREAYTETLPTGQSVQDARWFISISIDNGPIDGLLLLGVKVEPAQALLAAVAPVQLVRYAPDPSVLEEEGEL